MPTHQDVKEWYDRRYYTPENQPTRDEDPSVAYFYPRLGLDQPRRILDVACGEGAFLERASRDGHQIAGVDISQVAIDHARARLPQAQLHCATAERLPFEDRAFDAVTCFGALEHFLDIPASLAEMCRVAADDARFFIVVPNRWYLGWWLKRQPGTCQKNIQEKLCSRRGWEAVFHDAGLLVQRVQPDRRPSERWWVHQNGSAFRRAGRTVKGTLLRVSPLAWQYQFLFELRKQDAGR
jgi:SAM-dependent methyltransferase